jgi:hypothetical protein
MIMGSFDRIATETIHDHGGREGHETEMRVAEEAAESPLAGRFAAAGRDG